jgi:hypothetical protein
MTNENKKPEEVESEHPTDDLIIPISMLDRNQDGQITVGELKRALQDLAPLLEEQDQILIPKFIEEIERALPQVLAEEEEEEAIPKGSTFH